MSNKVHGLFEILAKNLKTQEFWGNKPLFFSRMSELLGHFAKMLVDLVLQFKRRFRCFAKQKMLHFINNINSNC